MGHLFATLLVLALGAGCKRKPYTQTASTGSYLPADGLTVDRTLPRVAGLYLDPAIANPIFSQSWFPSGTCFQTKLLASTFQASSTELSLDFQADPSSCPGGSDVQGFSFHYALSCQGQGLDQYNGMSVQVFAKKLLQDPCASASQKSVRVTTSGAFALDQAGAAEQSTTDTLFQQDDGSPCTYVKASSGWTIQTGCVYTLKLATSASLLGGVPTERQGKQTLVRVAYQNALVVSGVPYTMFQGGSANLQFGNYQGNVVFPGNRVPTWTMTIGSQQVSAPLRPISGLWTGGAQPASTNNG